MESKNKVFRDIYATGIKKPYINLSKAKFNKIFDYKLKKKNYKSWRRNSYK